MTKVLILDNYDSFTYNLVHLVEKLMHVKIDVFKNDQIGLDDIANYDKIILSPGPGLPDEAGILKATIKQYATTKSILGVCLGHQAIGEVFGARLVNLDTVFHGVSNEISITDTNEKLFKGLGDKITVGRYHSWVIDRITFPDELTITAVDEFENIMGIRHKNYDIRGVQFHPESIMTPDGEKIISNWLFA
jgi:anthranilate synthase component 2